MKKLLNISLGICLLTPTIVMGDVERECRGVAAGVVSSMRANNEIESDAMMKASILAARRACIAALEGFSADELSSDDEQTNKNDDKKDTDEKSVWEFLSQEQDNNPGHERLKKRRQ